MHTTQPLRPARRVLPANLRPSHNICSPQIHPPRRPTIHSPQILSFALVPLPWSPVGQSTFRELVVAVPTGCQRLPETHEPECVGSASVCGAVAVHVV
jgi:hypothetical protein